jgi:hypothetical protein
MAGGCQQTLVVGHAGADGGAPGPASLTAGLVAYWKLDDQPGVQTVRDSAGFAGAVPEAVSLTDWIPGRIGGALDFGNAGWLRGTEVDAVNAIASSLSVAMWIRLADREDREQVIVTRQIGAGRDEHFLLSLRLGRPALSGATLGRCEGPALATGTWVALAATFDGTFERLYLDGALAMECPSAGGFAPDTTGVTVGGGQFSASPFDVDRRLRATLDEIVLYDRPLTADEISALAAGRRPPLL